MKKITIILATLVVLVFTGCGGGSKNMYVVQPTPIEHGKSTYVIDNFTFSLVEKSFGNDNSKYKKEDELKKDILKSINDELKVSKLLGDVENSYKVDIDLHYERIFMPVPKTSAVQKPTFYYTIKVYNNDKSKLLVDFSINKSTTKYAYLKELAVSVEILAFQWNYEDEPLDINLMCKTLVEDIQSFGE